MCYNYYNSNFLKPFFPLFSDERALQAGSTEEEAGAGGRKNEKNGGGEEKETRRTQKVNASHLYSLWLNRSLFLFLFNLKMLSSRKRDERLRRVFEAKVKEEQRDMEKKKKIEQKMAQFDDKVCHKFGDVIYLFTSKKRFNPISDIWYCFSRCSVWQKTRPKRRWWLNVKRSRSRKGSWKKRRKGRRFSKQ